ncbi:MAG TPA: DUF255 domain-containing protein [Nitrospirota bacterium]|nr:DUF255 domain-containing protein [Nitrospirota bacterium]
MLKKILTYGMCMVLLLEGLAFAEEFRFSPRTNKANLIRWRSWGHEMFDEAQKKHKLILLSLSAVWCHWCHIMDETTYSDPELIDFINNNVIPVRVDADMRPDIDSLYNQGGWPSTVILTPEGEVISGGNYLPPEELIGRLKRASDLYATDRDKIRRRVEQAEMMRALRRRESAGAPGREDIENIIGILRGSFDAKYGGFGSGQKFPSPETLEFLLSVYAKGRYRDVEGIITTTLDRMADGQIHDKTEGGFFRYATKPDWSAPHYEKMLDVNAGLIKNYAEAYQVFGRKEYLSVVLGSTQYVQKNLFDKKSGAFYGSQDADESYYEALDRKGMKAPAVDTTSYSDSSSLMISALIATYGATADKQYLDMAIKGMDFLLANLYSGNDGMFHYYRDGTHHLKGLLSDNALAGSALLDLYNATGEERYLNAAKANGQFIIGQFYDKDKERFRPSLDTSLSKPLTAGILSDVNENLANFRAIRFLSRLAFVGEFKGLKETSDAAAAAIAGEYRRFTTQAGIYGTALLWFLGDPVVITVLAEREDARNYLSAINSVYTPEKVVRVLSFSSDAQEIKDRGYPSAEAVYLCVGKRCSMPINKPENVTSGLKHFMDTLHD